MPETYNESVLARLDRLERDNKRMKRVCLVVATLIIAVVSIGATFVPQISPVIRTHRLEVVGTDGAARAVLSAETDHHTFLQILNDNGKPGVDLNVTVNSPIMRVADSNGESLAVLADYGGGGLTIFDQAGCIRGTLWCNAGAESQLTLYDADNPRASIGLNKDGDPEVALADRSKTVNAAIRLKGNNEARILVKAENGKAVQIVSSNDLGLAAVSVVGKSGKPVAILEDSDSQYLGASLLLYDDDSGRLNISLTGKGPSLSLYDDNNERVNISITEKLGPSLRIFGSSGDPRAAIGCPKDSGAAILWDSDGQVLWSGR